MTTREMKGSTAKEMTENKTNGFDHSNGPPVSIEVDALVVGAGFSGITAIHRFRKVGLTVKCFEASGDFGGVWNFHRYPGARVDSEVPFYQLNIPEVYRDWTFAERFPGHEELRKYVTHVAKVLDLERDTYFNARVNDASWDQATGRWTIKTEQGHVASATYLILGTGLLHRANVPDFPGLSEYQGEVFHSAAWDEDFSPKDKKIGVIGAGSTGVQLTESLGKMADKLTVFVRRPSYCCALGQRALTAHEQHVMKRFYPVMLKAARESHAGFPVTGNDKALHEATLEERERHWSYTWDQGGFSYGMLGYKDLFRDKEANEATYQYWRSRVAARLTDPAKFKIMAPEEKPYYFLTKRMPLEQDYYEVLNQSNVHIHDLSKSTMKGFTPKGLIMEDGTQYELDAVVLATGFDAITGSITRVGVKNKDGVDLKDIWADGIKTFMGITVSGFPNMFVPYSPQAPTPFTNAVPIIEAQVELVVDIITKVKQAGAKSIEATRDAEIEWKDYINALVEGTLFPYTDSWWNGADVPGKKKEMIAYVAGIKHYEAKCRDYIEGLRGFNLVIER